MTPIDAGHPDYDNAEGIDDLPLAPGSGGGMFPDYPSIQYDSILGVPFIVRNAVAKQSKADNAKEDDFYCVAACEFVQDMPKKVALPKHEDGDPMPVKAGTKFSFSGGGWRTARKLDAMMRRRGLGEGVEFDPPFGPVMLAKVPGDKSGRARDLVGYTG